MLGSPILDVAVGLIFVFLLVSLLVTAATELIAAWMSWRPEKLWDGIRNLVDSSGSEEWTRKLYDHPLIKGLSPLKTKGFSLAKIAPRANGPSYIPCRTFSAALLDLLQASDSPVNNTKRALCDLLDSMSTSTLPTMDIKRELLLLGSTFSDSSPVGLRLRADLGALANNVPDPGWSLDQLKKAVQGLVKNIPSLESTRVGLKERLESLMSKSQPLDYFADDFKRDIQEILSKVAYSSTTAQLIKRDLEDSISNVPDRKQSTATARAFIQNFTNKIPGRYLPDLITQVPSADLRRTLTLLSQESDHDLEKFKDNIETWFNNAMDRVSGWYKRKTQVANLLLGIAFALALNLDSLLIVKTLSTQTALRDALVAEAKTFAGQSPIQQNASQPTPSPVIPQASPQKSFELVAAQFDRLNLPIGWTSTKQAVASKQIQRPAGPAEADRGNDPDFRQWPGWFWQDQSPKLWLFHWWNTIRCHFIGWTVTAIAVSLGAPFWFDLLNRIVAIRSSGNLPSQPSGEKTKHVVNKNA